MKLTQPHRQASRDDAAELAELVNMAGEGMPVYLWQQLASYGQSAWDVGRERARREEGGFSFRNTIVREENGRAVASLVGYPLADSPEPVDSDTPPMFVPLLELENLAPGSWYVNVLATYPDYRGRGYGSQLLGIAEQLAAACECRGLSIIVSDANAGAQRLYERSGYRALASRPKVKEGWDGPGENWILMVRDLPSPAG